MTNERMIEIIERKTSIPWDGESWDEIDEAYNMAIKYLKERHHGKWILQSHSIDGFFYTCSVCNRMIRVSNNLKDNESLSDYPYCHCGADMRDSAENE